MDGELRSTPRRKNLVGVTADRLRDMVFAVEPDTLVGSLQELTKALDVGIVTIQQAARVLEHEGLLDVRRGPKGGYYGRRPDAAAVERSIAAYLRSHPTSYREALNITSLLFNELVAAAAGCPDAMQKNVLSELLLGLDDCRTSDDCGAFEAVLQDLLFRMVDWPLFKLLTVVTLQIGVANPGRRLNSSDGDIGDWQEGRRRIMAAILAGDADLARFEANRINRRAVMDSTGQEAG